MNKTIVDFTRQQIKEGIQQLPDDWQMLFKRMYSHKNLNLSIDKIVDDMPDDKLDWALTQVENSLTKLKEQ